MTKADLLAVLYAIVTNSNHPLATDAAIGSAAAGVSHAIYTRLTGDPNTLPDLDTLKDVQRYTIPQSPDTDHDDEE